MNGGPTEGNERNDSFTGEGGIEEAVVEDDALDDVDENDFIELPEVDREDDDDDEPDNDRLLELDEKEKVDEP